MQRKEHYSYITCQHCEICILSTSRETQITILGLVEMTKFVFTVANNIILITNLFSERHSVIIAISIKSFVHDTFIVQYNII